MLFWCHSSNTVVALSGVVLPACPSAWLLSCRLQVRDLVLKFFNADPAEYQVVFTRSATGALKLVGETFPWSK